MVLVMKSTFFLYVFFSAKKAKKNHFFIFCIEKNAFQTKKEKFYKILKNRHFAKGLVHGFCPKIGLFLVSFFFNKKARKKHFLIFWIERKFFGPQKWSFHKVEKNRHFAKGLVHGVRQKIYLFLIGFFEQKKPERNIFLYSG